MLDKLTFYKNLENFIFESNLIEGINRQPTQLEISFSEEFLSFHKLHLENINKIQSVYAPNKPIRDKVGMNVRVGKHIPVEGGMEVMGRLLNLLHRINNLELSPWEAHVKFEMLHPYMDGNGRTGRIIWAWHMFKEGLDPFALNFLHRFYYQTLSSVGKN